LPGVRAGMSVYNHFSQNSKRFHANWGAFYRLGSLGATVGARQNKYYAESSATITWYPPASPSWWPKYLPEFKDILECKCSEVRFVQIDSKINRRGLFVNINTGWRLDSERPNLFYAIHDTVWATDKNTRMSDDPGWSNSRSQYLRQDFESCAICVWGELAGVNFGCVRWGHRFDVPSSNYRLNRYAKHDNDSKATGTISASTKSSMKVDLPPGPGLAPSANFIKVANPNSPVY